MGKRRPSAADHGGPPMRHRHAISDSDWDRIKDLLPGRPGQPGWLAADNRLFVDAVLWIAKTGAPWRDLPERFGNWNSVWKRFDRWARKGTWRCGVRSLARPGPGVADPRLDRDSGHCARPEPPKSRRHRRTGRTSVGTQSRRLRDQSPRGGKRAGVAGEADPHPGQAADVTQAEIPDRRRAVRGGDRGQRVRRHRRSSRRSKTGAAKR